MLLFNNIKEIAYQTDYLTTIKLSELYPNLNNNDFWKEKWTMMYSKVNYLECLTRQDNFLMKERKCFFFVYCIFIRIFYIKTMVVCFKNGVVNMVDYLRHLYVDVRKQFIITKKVGNDLIELKQVNKFCDAENYVKNYILRRTKFKELVSNDTYCIIDMQYINISFSAINMERSRDNKGIHKYYSHDIIRNTYFLDDF